MLIVSSLAAIDSEKILLVQNKEEFWTLPGGKLNPGETERSALKRELSEKLPLISCGIFSFWNKVQSVTPTSGQDVEVHVFLGAVTNNIKPGAEIKASGWFYMKRIKNMRVSAPTRKILKLLVAEGRL
jgi:ADP-ribose pyrophosphatase YjhB (NUDIX family)